MERKEYRNIRDRSRYPNGPWDDEPDKIQWPDEATGLPCLIVRAPLSALCGYVGVPRNHPAYEMGYNEVEVDVHGGLSFASKCSEGEEEGTICHVVEPGEPDDVWWLGFDCGHAFDLVPTAQHPSLRMKQTYRDVAYVTEQCRQLAAQLKAM